ncbi:MAG: twin-arginine translocase subunit TatC [Alistipes sp.]|nr:twin-arginine translocase subunit TatC [Alistipes sp.]
MGTVNESSSSGEMTFFEHLEELRPHLVRAAAAIFVFMVVAFVSKSFIIDKVLMGPQAPGFPLNRLFGFLADRWGMEALRLNRYTVNMINTSMAGQFNLHLKISIVTAIVVAVPYALWELWLFIKPALTPTEIAGSRMFVFYISLCFLVGVLFGYFIIAPLTVNFFYTYTISSDIANMIDIGSYLSTIVNLSLACGVLFLLPILIYFLARMGIMTPAFMRKYRKHAFVVLLIFSAVITPPDVFSLMLVILPMYLLYEVGIVIAERVERKKALADAEFYGEADESADDQEEE